MCSAGVVGVSVSSTDTSKSKGRPPLTAERCRNIAVTCATARPYFTAAFTSAPSSICTDSPPMSNARPARRARMEAGLSSSRSHGSASHAARSSPGAAVSASRLTCSPGSMVYIVKPASAQAVISAVVLR